MGPFFSFLCLISLVLFIALAQQSQNFEKCPFICLLSIGKELFCTSTPDANYTDVSCQKDLINDRFIIGNRSSIRRIYPGGLKDLKTFTSDGGLSIFLNMNILELNVTSFTGLEGVLHNLEVLHVSTLHPDTLLHHRKITSLIFDSDRIPKLPDAIREEANVPTFLRLKPQDPSVPIEVNVEVRCHKCAGEQPIQESAILTFAHQQAVKSGETLDAFNMIYMDNCPTLNNGLGCPKNGSLEDYILNVNASSGWELSLEVLDESDLKVAGGTTRVKPLLLSVIIWCTVLTVLLMCLIAALVIRRRIRARKREIERRSAASQRRCSATSLKHIICGTFSCEELHRASLSNGGTWIYGTPSQNSCSNLLSETRSQYSFRPPPFPGVGYPHFRGSVYSTEIPPGYRASIPDFLTLTPRNKPSLVNGDAYLVNGDPGLPPLPTSPSFRVPGTPAYKRSHDGTFKMVQS